MTDLKQHVVQRLMANNIQPTPAALEQLLARPHPLTVCENIVRTHPAGLLDASNLPKVQHVENKTTITITKNYTDLNPVGDLKAVAAFFNSRYLFFQKHLSARLENVVSISHAKKLNREKVTLIGIVLDRNVTKNGYPVIELEDPTGTIRVIATKPEIIEQARSIIPDEVIGIRGSTGENIVFLNEIVWPELPASRPPNAVQEDVYAAFLSDVHIGSKKFMRTEFETFLAWTRGEHGDEEHQALAKKLRYLFFCGDTVDGVGIYPSQEQELDLPDIYDQYLETARLLEQIPKHVQIILLPGNHDYVRLAQPQPALTGDVVEPLKKLENLTLVSNPSVVNIHTHDHGGVNVLLYHGVSFDTLVPMDPALKDGYKKPDTVMKSLLQRRHLAPPYESGLVAGGEDFMIINELPDIFHTGHVHHTAVSTYRKVILINSGTWQAKTAFQEVCGHEPTPCQLPLVNLQTRKAHLLDFNTTQTSARAV